MGAHISRKKIIIRQIGRRRRHKTNNSSEGKTRDRSGSDIGWGRMEGKEKMGKSPLFMTDGKGNLSRIGSGGSTSRMGTSEWSSKKLCHQTGPREGEVGGRLSRMEKKEEEREENPRFRLEERTNTRKEGGVQTVSARYAKDGEDLLKKTR